MPGKDPASILFGVEKTGSLSLIDTVKEKLTEDSRLLAGIRAQPAKLRRHIDSIAAAFRKKEARAALPWSISGLWKADLFVGYTDSDRWVATTVKINPSHLEGARGLRIGIVPAREGATDVVRKDEARNLVICPLPHDGAFMQVFYQGWVVVQQFIAADAYVPKEVFLPPVPLGAIKVAPDADSGCVSRAITCCSLVWHQHLPRHDCCLMSLHLKPLRAVLFPIEKRGS